MQLCESNQISYTTPEMTQMTAISMIDKLSEEEQDIIIDEYFEKAYDISYSIIAKSETVKMKCVHSLASPNRSSEFFYRKRAKNCLRSNNIMTMYNKCTFSAAIQPKLRRNYQRRQKRALRKGTHTNSCKASSTTDLHETMTQE